MDHSQADAATEKAVVEARNDSANPIQVGVLTGADDRSYALGLTNALVNRSIFVEFIGSDTVDGPELHDAPLVKFINLRGDQSEDVALRKKAARLLLYYLRLLKYAIVAEPPIFHILWNNKFQFFDRTLLMFYYRLFARKIVLTAHNVNVAKRDGHDSAFNRLTLRIQYRLSHHIFVHTEKMKRELIEDFGALDTKISVIPFGINNTVRTTDLSRNAAKVRLGVGNDAVTALFFGQIAPYKGLEYLIDALPTVVRSNRNFRLMIAGKVKRGHESYWSRIESKLADPDIQSNVVARIAHIPDEEVEVYFKAADVLIIPYTQIFQSGVPFLAYSFGLPVIATDVGSLKEDIVHGVTGYICRPRDAADLAVTIDHYLSSSMHLHAAATRERIRELANRRYSWETVGTITERVYRDLISPN